MLDRRFLDVSLVVAGIADSPAASPAQGTQYIVGSAPTGDFSGATANQLARWNGSKWIFSTLQAGGLEVLNAETGEVMSFDGTKWSTKVTVGGSGGDEVICESHTLTAEEATAQSFTLANSIKSGKENSVMLSVCGVIQIAGTDYAASGNAISWNDKTLADIGLQAGDVFLLQYVKA